MEQFENICKICTQNDNEKMKNKDLQFYSIECPDDTVLQRSDLQINSGVLYLIIQYAESLNKNMFTAMFGDKFYAFAWVKITHFWKC